MARPVKFERHALYGESPGGVSPEFVHIETISARSQLHDWTISTHAHAGIFQVVLVLAGRARMMADGGALELDLPCIVAVPSGSPHGFGFLPGTEGWVLSVAESLLLDRRLGALGVGRLAWAGEAMIFPLREDARLHRLLGSVMEGLAAQLPGPGGLTAPGALAAIALLIASLEELVATPGGAPGRRSDLVRRFARLVEGHYREHWPVSRYADALGVTQPTLTRACREANGRAPGEMILDRLLVEAMRGLSGSDLGIGELADALGFADPAYFARFFKARAGKTASAFRRERAGLRA